MKLLVSGAQLQCNFGNALAALNVAPMNEGFVADAPLATLQDFAPMTNIAPFGMCRSLANPQVAAATASHLGVLTPMPCVPATTKPWAGPSPDVEIRGLPVLLETSTCACQWGGTIQPVAAGQETVTIEQGTAGGGAGAALAAAKAARARQKGLRGSKDPSVASTLSGAADPPADAAELATLRIWLQDEYRQRMPNAPYRLTVGAEIRRGQADGDGLLVEQDLAVDTECVLEWGWATANGEAEFLFRRELRTGESKDDVLHNLGYRGSTRLDAFRDDYSSSHHWADVHQRGVPAKRRG